MPLLNLPSDLKKLGPQVSSFQTSAKCFKKQTESEEEPMAFNPKLEEVIVEHDTGIELEGYSVEELLEMAAASYPERGGPRRNNHRRREKRRFKMIRKQKRRMKYEKIAALQRKLDKKLKMRALFKEYNKNAPPLKGIS
eukprot:CAMPEP_0117749584 /NCGR_PEP_ID=MMETSP0947-20121206/9818_1 /TAXON_ID=44440 /ORGANISM="Chattonella subsalsa, Strain CCMP2191" /LENGTH=138 /DNA_ID=CAMNT_0005567505 /DNA_START=150 /DNA_END=566 /DNA_ORIENTATION=-